MHSEMLHPASPYTGLISERHVDAFGEGALGGVFGPSSASLGDDDATAVGSTGEAGGDAWFDAAGAGLGAATSSSAVGAFGLSITQRDEAILAFHLLKGSRRSRGRG